METNLAKVKTYIGFALKSRQIKFGVDDILKLKNASLILVSEALTQSGLKKINSFALKKSITCLGLSADDFNEIIQNTNIKGIAILDNNLADAIKKNLAN